MGGERVIVRGYPHGTRASFCFDVHPYPRAAESGVPTSPTRPMGCFSHRHRPRCDFPLDGLSRGDFGDMDIELDLEKKPVTRVSTEISRKPKRCITGNATAL